ncbi:hypothetical protein JIY74_24515 [Vibrio harveyi]|nr:hypothetical protein [Vibrio harveyi]
MINGQYKKALLMFAALPVLMSFILYSFGVGNVEGKGLLGLVDFGASVHDSDGRFYLVEGIISLILTFGTCLAILST